MRLPVCRSSQRWCHVVFADEKYFTKTNKWKDGTVEAYTDYKYNPEGERELESVCKLDLIAGLDWLLGN